MFTKDQIKPAVILLYTVIAVSVWYYFCSQSDFRLLRNRHVHPDVWFGSLPLFSAAVLFGLIPAVIVRWGFREKLADYGVKIGIVHRTVRSFLLAVPLVTVIAVWTGHNPAFYNVYPLNETLRQSENPPQGVSPAHPTPANSTYYPVIGPGLFLIHSLFYLGYYAGWEFLFRGFIQHGLTARCGLLTAILIQTLASTMLHYGHPPVEVFASIIAGIVWGVIAYRTQSVLSGFLQHSLLGIVCDAVLVFGQR
jgi:membrane protease YdiL (CAAX protease family)